MRDRRNCGGRRLGSLVQCDPLGALRAYRFRLHGRSDKISNVRCAVEMGSEDVATATCSFLEVCSQRPAETGKHCVLS